MKRYVICPVNKATPAQVAALDAYVDAREAAGDECHLPHRDVEQDDPSGGWNICTAHLIAMRECDIVDVFYDESSGGSKFDLGMAWALAKPVNLVAVWGEVPTAPKSYLKVVRIWHKMTEFATRTREALSGLIGKPVEITREGLE